MNWIYFRVFFFQHFRNTDYEAFTPWVLISVYGFGCTQRCKLLEQLDNQILWFCLSFMSVFFSKGTSYRKFIPGCIFLIVEDVWQGRHAEEFTAVASEEDGVLFYMTNDDTIALVFGLEKKTPSVVLLKQEDEKVSTFGKGFHILLAWWMNGMWICPVIDVHQLIVWSRPVVTMQSRAGICMYIQLVVTSDWLWHLLHTCCTVGHVCATVLASATILTDISGDWRAWLQLNLLDLDWD